MDTEQRFARWVNDHKNGRITLQKLKPSDVEAWRLALAQTPVIPQDKRTAPTRPRAPSTVNRDMTSLRTAFNLALENGDSASDSAWKTKLRPIKDADGRRDVNLDADQRRADIRLPKNHREITAEVSADLAKLRADMPDTLRGSSSLAMAAGKDGPLDKKTKELIAMALSVGAHSDPCLGFHADVLVKLGCSRAEFEEMLGMCIHMGGQPSLMYAVHAQQAFEQYGGAKAHES